MDNESRRVGVVSRRPVVLAGLRAVLEGQRGIELVETTPGDEPGPDVVLFDLADLDAGPDGLEQLLATGTLVIGVEPHRGRDHAVAAQRLGVTTVVSLRVTGPELAEHVRAAGQGAAARPDDEVAGGPVDLTPREYEVLSLVARGLTNQEIGARLFISINTVKTNIRSAYKKVGVGSRSQAVAWFVGYRPEGSGLSRADLPADPG